MRDLERDANNATEEKRRAKALVRRDRRPLDPSRPGFYYNVHAIKSVQEGKLATTRSKTGYDPLDGPYINPTFNLGEDSASRQFFSDHFANERVKQLLSSDTSAAANTELTRKLHENRRDVVRAPFSFWTLYCSLITIWAFPFCLRKCGIEGKSQQEAWREKIGLLSIIAVITLIAGFFTFGFHFLICNESTLRIHIHDVPDNAIVVHGHVFMLESFKTSRKAFIGGTDASLLMQNINGNCKYLLNNSLVPSDEHGNVEHYLPCVSLSLDGQPVGKHGLIPNMKKPVHRMAASKRDILMPAGTQTSGYQSLSSGYWTPYRKGGSYKIPPCSSYDGLRPLVYSTTAKAQVYYTWRDIEQMPSNLAVLNGNVVDLDRLLLLEDDWEINGILQQVLEIPHRLGHRDISVLFAASTETRRVARCLVEMAKVGVLDTESLGCLASHIVLVLSLIFVFSIVILKFLFAVYFEWFLAAKSGVRSGERTALRYRIFSKGNTTERVPVPAPENNKESPIDAQVSQEEELADQRNENTRYSETLCTIPSDATTEVTRPQATTDRHLICLVTVFNEDCAGISRTLDSICMADYAADKRLLLIICDGCFPRKEDSMCSADIVMSLVEESEESKRVAIDTTCVSLGVSDKKINRAQVHWGKYKHLDREIAAVVVVKKGTKAEETAKMPGNRGKRDSQIMLMRFLGNVAFEQRMTDFENELRLAIVKAYRFDASLFEAVLMVDADTEIYRDAIAHMTSCMFTDSKIIGLCGETEVRNKCDSWVTMIQVFEYFISHHLTKAFESVFGGVSCLPGCFCMYRIKVPSQKNSFLPVLCNTDIIVRYASTSVGSLHQKNLLLLGEDRYLSTLILQTFPQRKIVFVPQAKCKTIVPSKFGQLLHQRRRWINSTIHNLLELILVRDLCGVFCISMKMVILIELIGTVTLPAAMVFAVFLIAGCIYKRPVPVLPLVLLGTMLGIPAVLILLTGHKWIHVLWMAIYVISLPIWNFVLPLYACK